MTDRGKGALRKDTNSFTVGPSSMRWKNDRLVIDIDEIGAPPMVSRVRGHITVSPEIMTGVELPLTPDGCHIWRPFAPRCRIQVELEAHGWQWAGHGYFDANFGSRALEQDFTYWTWGRFNTASGATCFYDATRRDGTTLECAVRFDTNGHAHAIQPPPKARLRPSLWYLKRETRCDSGFAPYQVQAMLDAPFYNRSAVCTSIHGEKVTGVHEALDLHRFRSPFLKPMLAMRVPRRAAWRFDRNG